MKITTGMMMGALALLGGLLLGSASQAEAQSVTIGAGRQVPGFPVGVNSTVHPRWMFAIGNKIVLVNERGEVWTQDIRGNRVLQAIQVRGNIPNVGIDARMVFAYGNTIYLVTRTGQVYSQSFTRDTLGPQQPVGNLADIEDRSILIPAAGNRLINVRPNGQIWMYHIAAGQRATGRTLNTVLTGGAPQHFLPYALPGNAGSIIFGVWNNGQVASYRLGSGRLRAHVVQSGSFVQSNRWRFVFQMGTDIIGVTDDGRVIRHPVHIPAPAAAAAD